MKIQANTSDKQLRFTSESVDDVLLIGKLSVKITGAIICDDIGGIKELRVDFSDLLQFLRK